MKVLVVSAFPPDPAPEANHALHLSERLAESGCTVHVLCKNGSIVDTAANIIVHPVMKDWSWADASRLVACLHECQPDVVLLLYIGWVFNYEPMITYLPTYCKRVLHGVPCVSQFEIVATEAPARSLLASLRCKIMAIRSGPGGHWFFGTLLRDSVRLIVLSTPHRARLLTQDPRIEEKTVILPPPPLIRFCMDSPHVARREARKRLGAEPDDFVWIYWGYIYPGKGVETLLRAFRILSKQNVKARLALVGGNLELPDRQCNDYFQMVQRLPGILGIADKVTWTGNFKWDSDEGSRYLYAADACVLPFDYGVTLNSSSLAAASTHGVPVIGTEIHAGRDDMLEHGRNIYLCPPREPALLAEAMRLISENIDFRERLRSGILDLAEQWHHWDAMAARMVGILESAVVNKPHRQQHHSFLGTQEKTSPEKSDLSGTSLRRFDGVLPDAQKRNHDSFPLVTSEDDGPGRITVPLVSVIVAVYNVEKYLSQCLDSLVNQTLKNVEIVVVNDASTDASAKIIDAYSAKHSSVRVIHCDSNRGLAAVRNIGMRAARGKYIAFTDGDDWADIRFCEVLYRRANEDEADILIGDATVFYENSKTFGPLFDRSVRQSLDPQLSQMPFDLQSEPRILLLEPVAWTKLYRRSFLEEHSIQFEDGMNSYEDICFHFSVLVKAARISILDKALLFYRTNRPGQISGRTDRKIFEVFDVFHRIHQNLSTWDVSLDVWTMLVKVQLRQFDWLLKDRVQTGHKREFLKLVANQFAMIRQPALRNFMRQASPDELSRLFCMRRNWLYAYERVTRQRWALFTMVYVAFHKGRGNVLKTPRRRGVLRRRAATFIRSSLRNSSHLKRFKNTFRNAPDGLAQQAVSLHGDEPLIEACRINSQTLFLSRPGNSGLEHAVRRMQSDYYLTQTAAFREGDVVIDVGAHVGVVAIYLSKMFPFIKVYAIEPEPRNYLCLTRNIEINGATNVTPINKAISRESGQRTLYVDAQESAWATINPAAAVSRRTLRTAPVDTINLDQLFQERGIRHCRLLKITTPGAVGETLAGMTKNGCVDLISGEVDLEDCNRVNLEIACWRIARQHFWRTIDQRSKPPVDSWISQLPVGSESAPCIKASQSNTFNIEG